MFNLITVAETKQPSTKVEVPSFQQNEGKVYPTEVNFVENANAKLLS